MEAKGRRAVDPLIELLRSNARSFEFAQAAVLLRRLVGAGVRFRSSCSLKFPSAEVEAIDLPGEDGDPARMTTSFFGLVGAMGVLPFHYSEMLGLDRRAGGEALTEFLDIFHHRLTQLFLDAHLQHRFWLGFGAADQSSYDDIVFCLCGMAEPEMRDRAGLPRAALPYYAGLLAQRPVSAHALCSILGDFFGVDVSIAQFTGSWVGIPETERNRLGSEDAARLGESLVLGDRFHDPSGSFRISVRGLRLRQLERFLPGGSAADVLRRLIPVAVGHGRSFDYELELVAADVPEARLTLEPRSHPRLGRSLWLRSNDVERSARSGPFVPRDVDEADPTHAPVFAGTT